MYEIYILILILILFLSIILERNIYNPSVIFTSVWILVMFLGSLKLFELNQISTRVYFLCFMGVCFFSLGCLFRKKVKILKREFIFSKVEKGKFINYRFLIPFYSIILLFTVVLAIKSIQLMMHGVSMETIRFNYDNLEEGYIITSSIGYKFETYIVATSEFAAVALLPIVLTDTDKKRKLLFVELICFLILHMFVTGARSFMIDVVFVFFIYLLIDRDARNLINEKVHKIPKYIYIILTVIAAALVIYMTFLRKGNSENTLLRELYRYFAISCPLFDVHLNLLYANRDYTNGWAIIYGIVRPWFSIAHSFGVPFPSGLQFTIDQMNFNNAFFYVGGGKANSFVSVFYYMCMDFGIIGIPFLSFFYGVLSQSSYLLLTHKKCRRSQAVYLLMALGLFLSFVRSFLSAHRYVYAFLILYFAFTSDLDNTLKYN